MSDNGIVNIHGKNYQTVAKRVADFRAKWNDCPLITEVISSGDVVVVKATIKNPEGVVMSTGYAEEVRGSTNINKTSALENCETSAVGRALAFFGLGGTEIASANEVSDAIIKQAKDQVAEYFKLYNGCLSRNMADVVDIRNALDEEDYLTAAGLWYDFSEEDQKLIYSLAPSKGGVLTTKHREQMKTTEFTGAKQ